MAVLERMLWWTAMSSMTCRLAPSFRSRALIRLTFHCEPCRKILKLVDPKTNLHRRGVFGTFLNSGRMRVNDAFAVTELDCTPEVRDDNSSDRHFKDDLWQD